MEKLADAVPAKVLHARVSASGSFLGDDFAKVSESSTGSAVRDGLFQGFARAVHELLRRFRLGSALADVIRFIQIAVVSVQANRDVQIDDVAVLERARVGNAVTHDLVHGCAQRLWETHVVERRRIRAVSNRHRVTYTIELLRRDAGLERPRHCIHHVSRQRTRRAHRLSSLMRLYLYGALES